MYLLNVFSLAGLARRRSGHTWIHLADQICFRRCVSRCFCVGCASGLGFVIFPFAIAFRFAWPSRNLGFACWARPPGAATGRRKFLAAPIVWYFGRVVYTPEKNGGWNLLANPSHLPFGLNFGLIFLDPWFAVNTKLKRKVSAETESIHH